MTAFQIILGLGFILLLGGVALLAAVRSAPLGTQYRDHGFVADPPEQKPASVPDKRAA